MKYSSIAIVFSCVLLTAVGWSYWTTLLEIVQRWSDDTQYSHGYLVPLFSCYLLYSRREYLRQTPLQGSWWGIPVLLFAGFVRLAGTYYFYVWADALSLIISLFGMVLLVGGRTAFRWSWSAILFLAFMMPLPYRVQMTLGLQLQALAAKASVFLLQTMGVPSIAEGNVISLSEVQLNVAEACNGLGMLMTFFAISTALAILLSDQPRAIRIFIILSAIPIAVIANVLRIALTGFLYQHFSADLARLVFHDLAGWLMMPLAVALIFLQLFIFNRLFVLEAAPKTSRLNWVS